MNSTEKKRSPSEIIFWAIFIFAGVVRFKDLSTGLPLHTLYGESDTLQILLGMIRTGELNPHQFDLPGLAYYMFLPFFYLFYSAGYLLGHFPHLESVPDSSFIFVGRFICAVFGTLTVYFSYRIGLRFSTLAGLLCMAILSAAPQHIEYSHMLRPEIPAIFFVLAAHELALSLIKSPGSRLFCLTGVMAGLAVSLKYMVGIPLGLTILTVYVLKRKEAKLAWLMQSCFLLIAVFLITNPHLFTGKEGILHWQDRVAALYQTGEDYYGKNIFVYYIEFLTRYNYNPPLMLFAGLGILLSVASFGFRGFVLALYPLTVFFWLCSFDTRRTHGLLPLHPFLALWASLTLNEIWRATRALSGKLFFKIAYALLIVTSLFWPYYRTGVQAYLFSRMDNRGKAELWMVSHLPRGARIALLQFSQVELDSFYFNVQSFPPRDYVLSNKNFKWFQENGFDYIVVSSGQYMRYFIEGESAAKYKDYFRDLFKDGEQLGVQVLDLAPHPLLIPNYRIKVYATQHRSTPPRFIPAIDADPGHTTHTLTRPGIVLSLDPGYYSLSSAGSVTRSDVVQVNNLKSGELILKWKGTGEISSIPFTLFPVWLNSRFHLFAPAPEIITPGQLVKFQWSGIYQGLVLDRRPPAIRVTLDEFLSQSASSTSPFLLFDKNEQFRIRCTLRNRGDINISGYIEATLSQIGEFQPWKNFDLTSAAHEFFLEPSQRITIEIPMTTGQLTGDYQLSYWIFTRQDLPFSPQNGGVFNKQIRVSDPELGIHPIYRVPIP